MSFTFPPFRGRPSGAERVMNMDPTLPSQSTSLNGKVESASPPQPHLRYPTKTLFQSIKWTLAKRVLVVLMLTGTGVICLGFYLRWFPIGSDGTDGKTLIKATMEQNKINAGDNIALEKVP
jgi:hypothetical protein